MYRLRFDVWYDEMHRRIQPVQKIAPAHAMKKVIFQNR